MSTRLQRRLGQAGEERRGILMGFLPGGYPTPDRFRDIARAAFDSGLDALEVSMPGPAPELDGPLIQEAARQASKHLDGVSEALQLAASARSHPDDTIVALAYLQTFETIGADEFLSELKAADVDAYILPQHPVAEQLKLGVEARKRGIEPIIFLHLQEDLARLVDGDIDHPVIYLQSADSQTGSAFNPVKARERLSELAEAFGDKPYMVCVGFGVRGNAEAKILMDSGADGVVIGTRLVSAMSEGADAVTAIIDDVAPALVRRSENRDALSDAVSL